MPENKTKIIFFGTSDFALPALKALLNEGYNIISIITTPDKPAGRKQIITPPPVKVLAYEMGLNDKVIQPEKLKNNSDLVTELAKLSPEIGIVAAYGKIIPLELINLPKHGLINIHPSLLPKYRGPSPIQTALLNGDIKTGVTIMKVDEELDHGKIISAKEVDVLNEDTYLSLHDKLAKLGSTLLIKTLPDYMNDKTKPSTQDESKVTLTKKFEAADGEIKKDNDAGTELNKIRALNPEPGTFIWLENNDKKMRLKIVEAELGGEDSNHNPGNLFLINNNLALKLKNGYIIINKVQLEGKKVITGKIFAATYKDLLQK